MIVANLFKFMFFTIFNQDQSAVVAITQYKNLEEMLLKSTVITENMIIRNEILKKFKEMILMRS